MNKGKYRHFKGNEYELLHIAKDSETSEDVVVYKALYAEQGIWIRPLSMWNELVMTDGKLIKRFTYIGDYIIESARVGLRKITDDDFNHLKKMLGDKDVMYAWGHNFCDTKIRDWIRKRINSYEKYGYDYFLAIDKKSGDIIGQVGLLNEDINGGNIIGIGYILNKQYWGQGYATECATACLEYAFKTLNANRVICDIRPDNIKSINVSKRIGMIKTGSYVKVYDGKDMIHDIYEIKKGSN